jgi:DNA-directed RNA polymerase subunit RPC12/RpoP
MRERYQRCPSCGKRFGVRVLGKVLENTEHGSERLVHNVVTGASTSMSGHTMVGGDSTSAVQVPIERDKFEVAYACSKCGHKWTATLMKARRV